MVVFSNRRLGPAVELIVSHRVASEILLETSQLAAARADGRWERELADWLGVQASAANQVDVCDIAWSPEHFERQRAFLLAAIAGAMAHSNHQRALRRWAAMIEAHPRDSVQVGRRWAVHTTT